MATLGEAVKADLEAAGASPDILDRVDESIQKNFPKKTYELAVWSSESQRSS